MRAFSSTCPARASCRFCCAAISLACLGVAVTSELEGVDAPFRRGDANVDGVVDLADGVRILGALFLGSGDVSCEDALDADDSGVLDLSDAIYLLRHLFAGTPAPPTPGIENCGLDFLGRDSLSCDEYLPSDAALACHPRASDEVLPLPLFLANDPGRRIVVRDFDGDGRPDIVSEHNRQLEIRFGAARRGLSAPQLVDVQNAPPLDKFVCADLDGSDGIDVVRFNAWRYRVLSNDGKGRFQLSTGFPLFGSLFGHSPEDRVEEATMIDVNGDAVLDLVFFTGSAQLIDSLIVVPGMPGGKFAGPVRSFLPTPETATLRRKAFVSADFDNDALTDVILLGGFSDPSFLLLRNDGDMTFSPTRVPALQPHSALVTGDFDGDGRHDLIASAETGSLSLLRGDGAGNFAAEIFYDDPANPFHDLFLIDDTAQRRGQLIAIGSKMVIFERGPRGFEPAASLPRLHSVQGVADLDGDGEVEFISTGASGFVALFSRAREAWRGAPLRSARALQIGDFDRDGTPDLIATRSRSVELLLNDGDGTFLPVVSQALLRSPRFSVSADFDGDGWLDVAVVHRFGVTVLLNEGADLFTELPEILTDASPRSIRADDFDSDGFADLVLLIGDRIAVLWGRGDGSLDGPFSEDPRGVAAIALGDVDGDGNSELVASYAAGVLRTFRGVESRLMFDEEVFVGRSSTAIEIADMNGDGWQDLLLLMGERIEVRLGARSGIFAQSPPLRADIEGFLSGMPLPHELQVVDVDQDGILDVVSRFAVDGLILLRGRGDGAFHQPDFFGCCSGSVAFADLTGNGRTDVVSDGVVYLNQGQ